jgi:hypothetical protein
MVDIPGMIAALQPAELEILRSRGREQVLDAGLVAAIDAAAGGPGEGRGYYVVNGPLWPIENREYHLRSDVASAIFDSQRLDPQGIS